MAVPLFLSRLTPWEVEEGKDGRRRLRFQPTPAACLLLLRLVNALVVRTYFNPDEYWQGPEVTHRLAYGYGFL